MPGDLRNSNKQERLKSRDGPSYTKTKNSDGFDIMAMFDVDPEKIGQECNGIKIMDMKDIESFIRENDIDIAMLTLPKTAIEDIANDLVEYGIKGLWNFAYVELKTKKPVPVENVHLTDSLMTLSFKINQKIEE